MNAEAIYLAVAVPVFVCGYVWWARYWFREFDEIGPIGVIWAAGPAVLQAFLWPLWLPLYLLGVAVRKVTNR